MSKKPYAILTERVQKSPMKTIQTVKITLAKYHQGVPIGFSRVSSLKSMGLLPRSDGLYRLSSKYHRERTVNRT